MDPPAEVRMDIDADAIAPVPIARGDTAVAGRPPRR
jgi:hypothetical protein